MARGKKITPARRKRRWIGISFLDKISTKEELSDVLDDILIKCNSWKIYDFCKDPDRRIAIIRVDRSDEVYVRNMLSDNELGVVSSTSSGKIKLVRERLGIHPEQSKSD